MMSLIFLSAMVNGVIERGEVSFRPTAEEARVPDRFRLEAAVFAYEMEPRIETRTFTVSAM